MVPGGWRPGRDAAGRARPGKGRGLVGLAPGEGTRPRRAGALGKGRGHFGGGPGRLWPPPKWPGFGETAEVRVSGGDRVGVDVRTGGGTVRGCRAAGLRGCAW